MRDDGPGGLPTHSAGRDAVVVSWHQAPDFGTMPGQDRMLGIWAEPLLDALVEAGFRTTLLIVGAAGDPAATPLAEALRRRRIHLAFAAGDGSGHDPVSRCLAVDAALERLAPDAVHAPERLGLLAAALSRRAAGLAHLDCSVVLHARGPSLFQAEEQGRFIDDADLLLLDDLERQAMRLADQVVCCSPDVAGYLAGIECRLVAPLACPWPAVPTAAPVELVFPLPLCSEAGLEFAVAALARACARGPFPLPVTFLGQPGAVTVGNAASVLAGLAPPAVRPGEPRPEARLDWRVVIAETPQQAMQYLARPGRVALLTSARATPPEMLAMCGMAGIPVLATANAASEDAARRWHCIHVLPRAERGFAAALARLPALPPAMPADPPPTLPWPELFDARALPRRALALLAEPAEPELTLIAEARPGLVAQLQEQTLRRFGVTLLLATDMAAPASIGDVRLVSGGPGALGRELSRCETRYAVLCGAARALAPDAMRALLRAARASGAPAIAAWDSASRPTGGGGDMALLRPGSTVGHVVLLDLPALRARGGVSLAAAGTADFAAALAIESGGVMMLAAILAEAARPPPLPAPPRDSWLPSRLRGAAAMALHFAAPVPAGQVPGDTSDMQRALAGANRESVHYLKLLGRLLDQMGMPDAAYDIWAARLARDADDGETWTRMAGLALTRTGRLPDGLEHFVRRHGPAGLDGLPEAVAGHALDLLQANRPEEAMALLTGAAPALQDTNAFIQALARVYARLARRRGAGPTPLPRLAPPAHAALRSALENYALALPPLPAGEDAA